MSKKIKDDFKDIFSKVKSETNFWFYNYFQALTLMEDALIYTKTEGLSQAQKKALIKALQRCQNVNLGLDDISEIGKILRKAGMQTLPDLV